MIEIKNLSFGYNHQLIIKQMNLTVADGDFIAIVGGNGSGKSTLIKCLLAINPVNSGQIIIDRTPIDQVQDFRKFGYVQQLKPKETELPVTAYEYLRLISNDSAKIMKVATSLNLSSFINTKLNKLSGGQRQRVAIAKALLHNISYLILDEPNTGLDFASRKSFYQLLAQLNQQKLTIIIVSHHLDEISCQINKIYDMETHSLEVNNRDLCEYC